MEGGGGGREREGGRESEVLYVRPLSNVIHNKLQPRVIMVDTLRIQEAKTLLQLEYTMEVTYWPKIVD